MRYGIIGDVHGEFNKLISLYNKMEDEGVEHFVFCGDYIDRGSMSKEVLDFMMNIPKEKRTVLIGNHDEFLINTYNTPVPKMNSPYDMWMYNGGDATMKSFGVDIKSTDDFVETLKPYVEFLTTEGEYYKIIDNLLVSHSGGNADVWKYLLTGGSIKDEVGEYLTYHTYDLVWDRRNDFIDGFTIVHGHSVTSTKKVQMTINNGYVAEINVDCGAVFGNPLGGVIYDSEDSAITEIYSGDR